MSVWVPVVAALGASLLTFLGSWVLEGQRRRGESGQSRLDSRRDAYVQLLTAANGVLLLGQGVRSILMADSGLGASLAELARLRRATDVRELVFSITAEVRPLLDARARVLTCGTVAAAEAASKVAVAATDYLAVAGEMSTAQRALHGVLPWRPNAKQEQALQLRLDAVGEAVAAFVAVVRRETGEGALPLARPTMS